MAENNHETPTKVVETPTKQLSTWTLTPTKVVETWTFGQVYTLDCAYKRVTRIASLRRDTGSSIVGERPRLVRRVAGSTAGGRAA